MMQITAFCGNNTLCSLLFLLQNTLFYEIRPKLNVWAFLQKSVIKSETILNALRKLYPSDTGRLNIKDMIRNTPMTFNAEYNVRFTDIRR